MKIFAVVPVKRFENAKTRMSTIFSLEDRILLCSLMLDDSLAVLKTVPELQQIIVVSNDRQAQEIAARHGVTFLQEEKQDGVNSAVMLADDYSIGQAADATLVIPQDLPLLNALDIKLMCSLPEGDKKCVVICPSQRYDGTNALFRRPPFAIRTFFDNNSYEGHIGAARAGTIPIRLYFSKNLMFDIDTPEDARQLVREARNGNSKVLKFLRSRVPQEGLERGPR